MPAVPRYKNPNAPDLFDLATVNKAFDTASHQLRGLCVHWAYHQSGGDGFEPSSKDLRYIDEIQAEMARVQAAVYSMLKEVTR